MKTFSALEIALGTKVLFSWSHIHVSLLSDELDGTLHLWKLLAMISHKGLPYGFGIPVDRITYVCDHLDGF